MKNPNGYGSVSKLSGKRRRPFIVRITTGFDINGRQIMKVLGYYHTQAEAIKALANYNDNPYDINLNDITFKEILDRFMENKKGAVEKSSLKSYRVWYNYLRPLYSKRMKDIRTFELQNFINSLSHLSTGSLKLVKSFIRMLFKDAMEMDIISKDYSEYIKLPKYKKVIERKIFTEEEIALLWDNIKVLDYVDAILILIYTGMRINELLKLEKKNVNLENNTITGGSKTDAGKNRIIPIHPKILPLIIKRMENETDYLISNRTGRNYYEYNNFRQNEFVKIMEQLGMEHTIHDTRHTFATMISDVSDNENAITGIIGHTNINMTKKYTHTNIEKMRKEMEKIN
jgi:site-specific recombinase, phage integrase family